MDIEYLREFSSAVKHSSFTKAAQELGLTQPGISKHIASLEKNLGIQLFDRDHTNISLTPLGKLFFECTEEILFRLDSTIKLMNDLKSSSPMKLIVNTYAFYRPMEDIIAATIAQLKKTTPLLDISVKYIRDSPLEDVRSRKVDISFFSPANSSNLSNIIAVPLYQEPLVAIVGHKHRLATHHNIEIDDLTGEQILVFSDAGVCDCSFHIQETFDSLGAKVSYYYKPWIDNRQFFNLDFDTGVVVTVASVASSTLPLPLARDYKKLTINADSITIWTNAIYREDNKNPALPIFMDALREIVADISVKDFWKH